MVFLTFDNQYAVVTSSLEHSVFLLLFKRPFLLQEGRILGRVMNDYDAAKAVKSFLELYGAATTSGYKISDGHFVHPKYRDIELWEGIVPLNRHPRSPSGEQFFHGLN